MSQRRVYRGKIINPIQNAQGIALHQIIGDKYELMVNHFEFPSVVITTFLPEEPQLTPVQMRRLDESVADI